MRTVAIIRMFPVCMTKQNYVLSAVYCTSESSFDVKVEADSNDITEHPHYDKPAIESRG